MSWGTSISTEAPRGLLRIAPGTIAFDAGWRSMKEIGPIPIELHIACLVVAGLIVSIAYRVDWKQVFG
jgi:hypothetical protein